MNDTLLHRLEMNGPLINKVVNDIPEEYLLDSSSTVYEPECAGAQFSIASVNRMRDLGFSREEALNRVFCSSQSKISLAFAKTKGLKNYYLNEDLPTKMKHTININNFPYGNSNKKQKAGNAGGSNGTPLYTKLLVETCDVTDKMMLSIAPSVVANLDGKTIPAMRRKGFYLQKVEFGMEKYFPTVKTQIGYFVFNREKTDIIKVNGFDLDMNIFKFIPNVESQEQIEQLSSFIGLEKNGWKYLDNRSHHKILDKENYLIVRRMYNKPDKFVYNRGLDMEKFDKESVLGLHCPNKDDMERWIEFFESNNASLLRKTTSYGGNVSTSILGYVNV